MMNFNNCGWDLRRILLPILRTNQSCGNKVYFDDDLNLIKDVLIPPAGLNIQI